MRRQGFTEMGAEEGGMVDYDENAAVTIVALPTLFFNDEQPKWLHVHNSQTLVRQAVRQNVWTL